MTHRLNLENNMYLSRITVVGQLRQDRAERKEGILVDVMERDGEFRLLHLEAPFLGCFLRCLCNVVSLTQLNLQVTERWFFCV